LPRIMVGVFGLSGNTVVIAVVLGSGRELEIEWTTAADDPQKAVSWTNRAGIMTHEFGGCYP